MDKDNDEFHKVEKLLQSWATKICESTNDIISSALGRGNEFTSQGTGAIFDDMRDRQSRIITTIQEAHSRQLEMLKTAVAEERKEFARAQLIFEQSLKTKYDHIVDALQETVKSEHDSRLLRTVKALEMNARLESEKAKVAFEMEHEVEMLLAKRLKGIITDLRRAWEIEESQRLKAMEERLRSSYNVLLEHLESQLRLALQHSEEQENRWLAELEARNSSSFQSLKLFEERCRQSYEAKLSAYMAQCAEQCRQYEDALLAMGSEVASEKAQFESRLKRIKLACSRWKMSLQRELHSKYTQLASSLEDKYLLEIDAVVKELEEVRGKLGEAKKQVDSKEKEVHKMHEMYVQGGAPTGKDSGGVNNLLASSSLAKMRADLSARWDELKTPAQERVQQLAGLLDSAAPSLATISIYEAISAKLADKAPIVQLLNRKQFLEYKLKLTSSSGSVQGSAGHSLSSGMAGNATSMSAAERAELIAELSELRGALSTSIKQFEKMHNEPFAHPAYNASSIDLGTSALSPKKL